jgi:hypothetical protein
LFKFPPPPFWILNDFLSTLLVDCISPWDFYNDFTAFK